MRFHVDFCLYKKEDMTQKILICFFLFFAIISCDRNDVIYDNASNMFHVNTKVKKLKSLDYIQFSYHHEIYDVSIYNVFEGEINPDFYFPQMVSSDNVHKEKSVCKWSKCGNENADIGFPIMLTRSKFKSRVLCQIQEELLSDNNWYALLYTDNINHLFLFCPSDSILYHIEWNV